VLILILCEQVGMKEYAVALVRAVLPRLQHRLAKVRIAAIDAIRDLVKVPDRDKGKGAATSTILELTGFRADNVVPVSMFFGTDVSINYIAQVGSESPATLEDSH
jgi:hypothetical protein